jgi:hypothetical protein
MSIKERLEWLPFLAVVLLLFALLVVYGRRW